MNIESLELENVRLLKKLEKLEESNIYLKEKLCAVRLWSMGIMSDYGKMVESARDTSIFKDQSYIYAPYQPLYFSPRP